jgi:hypothetical protein
MLGSLRHQSVEVALNRYSIGLILIMSSAPVFAQRSGRADALQDYMGHNRNPRLLLPIKYEKTRLYFRVSNLQKKPRSIVKMAIPQQDFHTCTRVSALSSWLVPTGALNHLTRGGPAFRERQILAISWANRYRIASRCHSKPSLLRFG